MLDPIISMVVVLAIQNTCSANAVTFSNPSSSTKFVTSQKFFLKTLAVEISTKKSLWCLPLHLLKNDIASSSLPSMAFQMVISNGINILAMKNILFTFCLPYEFTLFVCTIKKYLIVAETNEWKEVMFQQK